MNIKEFSVVEFVETAMKRWWMIVILMSLGGIAGWQFHYFRPPLYQATAVITINLDFEKRQLTQYEEDYAFNAAASIINSSAVKKLVIAEAGTHGYLIDLSHIQTHFYLEGRTSEWQLHVRDQDPDIAAALANIWAVNANNSLNVALKHSLQADQLIAQVNGLENCLAGTPQGTPVSTQVDCKESTQDQIQVLLQDKTKELMKEKKSSLGISPFMSMGLTGSASVPGKPEIYNRAGLVLAGAVIGLVVSLWVVNILKGSHRG